MRVNREVENLRALLDGGVRHLAPGGRLAVISFQSTEDRLVKQAFGAAGQAEAARYRVLTKKPVVPSDAEAARNPRSRSAKLRAIQRL
jgi:16S rRNA (cytosine1402-N4)-methyltransferase